MELKIVNKEIGVYGGLYWHKSGECYLFGGAGGENRILISLRDGNPWAHPNVDPFNKKSHEFTYLGIIEVKP